MPTPSAEESLGYSLALSGDGAILAAAAPGWSSTKGRVAVFRRGGDGNWDAAPQQVLTLAAGQAGDGFGTELSLDRSGARLVVGVPGRNSATGAVAEFTRQAGQWTGPGFVPLGELALEAGDQFGNAVALSPGGDLLVVGALRESGDAAGIHQVGAATTNAAEDAGSAYVFDRQTGGWQPVAYLKAKNPSAYDLFGSSVDAVAPAGGIPTLAVGAPGQDGGDAEDTADSSSEQAGAVYLY
jgi:hypothetical protein